MLKYRMYKDGIRSESWNLKYPKPSNYAWS